MRNGSPARKLPDVVPAHAPANDPAEDAAPFGLPALPAHERITLAVLGSLLGAPDEGCRSIHLRDYTEEELLELGNKVDSRRIVDAAPVIVASTMRSLAALSPELAELVTLDPALLGVIAHEAAALHELVGRLDSSAAAADAATGDHAARCEQDRRDAIAQRDVVRSGLTPVLGPSRAASRLGAPDASDDAVLARGLDRLAEVLDELRTKGAPEERAQLARRRLGAQRAAKLRSLAARLRGAGALPAAAPRPSVTQRMLDVQDGRVLVLLDALVAGMRAAHRASRAIAMPEFGRLAQRYQTRTRKRPAPAPPKPE